MGIGEDRERPLVPLLIGSQPCRFGERNNSDRDAAPVEFAFEGLHLSEVRLARQSREMPEKD